MTCCIICDLWNQFWFEESAESKKFRTTDLLIEFYLEFEMGNVGKMKSRKNVIFNYSNGIGTVRIAMSGLQLKKLFSKSVYKEYKKVTIFEITSFEIRV